MLVAASGAGERPVRALYTRALGRSASDADLVGWQGVLVANGLAPVANGIERSYEARTVLVRGWYATYLRRPAQGGEEQGFVNALLNGATEEQILAVVLGSQEFFNLSGSADGFVRELYRLLLNRTPGDAEVAGWVNDLPQLVRDGIARSFLASAEHRGLVVRGYYQPLLRRSSPPSDGEVNGWVASGLDFTGIRTALESSIEFFVNG